MGYQSGLPGYPPIPVIDHAFLAKLPSLEKAGGLRNRITYDVYLEPRPGPFQRLVSAHHNDKNNSDTNDNDNDNDNDNHSSNNGNNDNNYNHYPPPPPPYPTSGSTSCPSGFWEHWLPVGTISHSYPLVNKQFAIENGPAESS